MDVSRVEVYGFATEEVDEVRAQVERALDLVFEPHQSELIGDYYFASLCGAHAELTLRANYDPGADGESYEDTLAEPDFPGFGTLLYVEWSDTGHTCRERVNGLAPDGQLLAVEE